MALVAAAIGISALLLRAPAHLPIVVSTNDPVVIKRTLTPNQDVTYHTESEITQIVTLPTGEEQKILTTFKGDAEFETGESLKDGKLPFTLTISKLKVHSDPEQPWDSDDRKIKLKGRVDELNVIVVDKLEGVERGDEAMSALVGRITQGIGTFPAQPIEEGEKWTVSEEAAFMGGKKLEYELQYDGEQSDDDKKFYSVSVDTDVPVEIDLGAMDDDGNPVSKPRMAMKGTVHISGQGLIDASGWLKTMTFETKAQITIDSPGAQGQLKISSDEIVKLERED